MRVVAVVGCAKIGLALVMADQIGEMRAGLR